LKTIAFVVLAPLVALPVRAAEPASDAANPVVVAKAQEWKPIPIGYFGDSVNHARMGYKHRKPPYKCYEPEQIVHIAENVLAWQNADGGWPKNVDWLRAFSEKELAGLPNGKRRGHRSSLDNRCTWAQIDYLARVHQQTGLDRYAAAANRGLGYLLKTQRSSGGWRGADVDAITFNDDVMTGVMRTLKAVVDGEEHYGFVSDDVRAKVQKAYDRGLACILKCQIKVGDRLTAWCQQHSHRTYEPVWARSFEPPSIVTAESVSIVRFLLTIHDPSPEVVRAIDAAVAWFDRVKIEGLRIKKVEAKAVHSGIRWYDFDNVEVKDPDAPPIWTRFYSLKDEKPIFCTRSRKVTDNYTDLSRERRTGYSWYGYYPAKLLSEEYPAWKKARETKQGATSDP
jgi:PelA/Pel-15E family pectate lyase